MNAITLNSRIQTPLGIDEETNYNTIYPDILLSLFY